MEFKNREGENLNRRKLTIISQNENEMIVDVERAETNIINEGTSLTAEVLNVWNGKIDTAYNSANVANSKSNSAETKSNLALQKAEDALNNVIDSASALGLDGGVQGQVLTKNTNNNLDFSWKNSVAVGNLSSPSSVEALSTSEANNKLSRKIAEQHNADLVWGESGDISVLTPQHGSVSSIKGLTGNSTGQLRIDADNKSMYYRGGDINNSAPEWNKVPQMRKLWEGSSISVNISSFGLTSSNVIGIKTTADGSEGEIKFIKVGGSAQIPFLNIWTEGDNAGLFLLSAVTVSSNTNTVSLSVSRSLGLKPGSAGSNPTGKTPQYYAYSTSSDKRITEIWLLV